MKRIIITIAAAASCGIALAIGASQEWVKQYVARAVAETTTAKDGSAVYKAGNGVNSITIACEPASVYALMATNVTASASAQGVRNGMLFVWEDATHTYRNATQSIEAGTDRLTWRGIASVGQTFPGAFDVVGRIIQPSVAQEVTK